jgi:hypothetical protein
VKVLWPVAHPGAAIAERMATGHDAVTDQVLENEEVSNDGKAMIGKVGSQPGNS